MYSLRDTFTNLSSSFPAIFIRSKTCTLDKVRNLSFAAEKLVFEVMSGNIIIDSELSTRRCNKCRNHGRLVTLKGHKPFCQFKNCSCKACTQLEMKKLSTALRRKEKIARDSKIGYI